MKASKTTRNKQQPQSAASACKVAIVIMAAGKGTRLKSKHPKVLHSIAGKTLLEYVIAERQTCMSSSDTRRNAFVPRCNPPA